MSVSDAKSEKLVQALRTSIKETERLKQLNRELVSAKSEPVAIVSMGCRYPGGVDTPEGLWQLMAAETDAISDFPEDRGWDIEDLYDPDPDARGKVTVCHGGFLRAVDQFDPEFFRISPREALGIDPQHRLLLETVWECLERAGIEPRTLQGSSTGVFVGLMSNDYLMVSMELAESAGMGSVASVASGRIAYTLGLQGPTLTVDTACSSSLVALHLACQSLRNGECELALAGGATVNATPGVYVEFSRQRGLAADGRCKSFSDSADGTGFSEGVGMLLLERLSDAQRHDHPVLALVRGSAVNQDGKSQGLTAPNGPAQEQVIRQALASAQLTAADIDAVEAHGTGTVLGDPIEAQALLATYGSDRLREQALWLGSLKTNVGHTQAAAGVGGVIKMVLALQHQRLPKTLHAEVPTRHVDWSAGKIKLLQEAVAWKPNGRPRRAAVSSFGVSGTNAHVILEQPPLAAEEARAVVLEPDAPLPFVVSAQSEAALRAQASRLRSHLLEQPESSLLDVAHSLVTTRTSFEWRAVAVAPTRVALLEDLQALSESQVTGTVVTGRAKVSGKRVFVFPGQGAQWLGMATELLQSSPVFAQQLQACAQALAPHVEWSLLEVLASSDASLLERVDIVQPVLFSVMVSLAALWRSLGVEPDAVVGHSQGEIAAAFVAGALSLSDAAKVVALRARALRKLSGRGGMAAVELGVAEVRARLARSGGELSIAAINSPHSTVVSGSGGAIDALLGQLAAAGILGRRIRVDYASHCAQLDEIRDELLEALADIAPTPGQIPFYSSLRAEVVEGQELDGRYWYDNGRETVRFAEAIEGLLGSGHHQFVEVSPHPVLTQALSSTAETSQQSAVVVGTLRREQGGLSRFLTSMGELHVRSHGVDYRRAIVGGRKVSLPTYAFQRERYWPEPDQSSWRASTAASLGQSASEHPLLGASVALADGEGALLTGRLSLSQHKWLSGHVVYGTTLFPGTGFVELALTAAHQVGLDTVEELTLHAPLTLPERGGVQLQVRVSAPDEAGRRSLTVHTRREDGAAEGVWTRHASGTLCASAGVAHVSDAGLRSWPPAGATKIDLDGVYERLATVGLSYADAFRGLVAAYRLGDELYAEMKLPDSASKEASRYSLHPALLDAAVQTLLLGEQASDSELGLPFAWQGVKLLHAGASALRVKVRIGEAKQASFLLADATGRLLGEIGALRSRPASAAQVRASAVTHDALYRVEWVPVVQAPSTAVSDAPWALLGAAAVAGLPDPTARYADVAALVSALESGVTVPRDVVLTCASDLESDVIGAAHASTHALLAVLQTWLAEERLAGHRLIVWTVGAVAADVRDPLSDLAASPLWGLVRSAISEHPDRSVRVVDWDGAEAAVVSRALFDAVSSSDEPQLAVREGALRAPRLTRKRSELAAPPPGVDWYLRSEQRGTLEGVSWGASEPTALGPNEVRVAVRAAGLNFRDVLITLGVLPASSLGHEGAGVVAEVGSGVVDLQPGDRVMGMLVHAFGPRATTDRRALVRVPDGMSMVDAATVPIAYLTAYYGLVDLGKLRAGERVLVHAGAGGVGMAALALAQHLGAEVFATASPSKWEALRSMGLDDAHIASSRTLEFEQHFRDATCGEGIDVVLNSLAGDFIDASLRLLRARGRFVEMGKTDMRDASEIAAQYGGTEYRAFELGEAGLDRVQQMLLALHELFAREVFRALPVITWDVRSASDALRYMAQARHVGKIVLTIPQPLAAEGTVLITGGTGTLGALVAEHLVSTHGVRHLLLCSRTGDAPELQARLEGLGATVKVAACDVSQRSAVERLLQEIPAEHPLTAIIHTAGALDDGTLSAQSAQRVDRVFAPKLAGAWHLHELTRGNDLQAFVLFSSAAGVLGGAGQSNYAAANSFLDALAQHRRAQGLCGISLAWGYWAERTGLTEHLKQADVDRMSRAGIQALSTSEGLALFDAALCGGEAQLVPMRLDARLTSVPAEQLPPLLRGLGQRRLRPLSDAPLTTLEARLSGLDVAERERQLLEVITGAVSRVLGLAASRIEPDRPLSELGLDSLMAVELRNQLAALSGLRLQSTLLFDHPTPDALRRVLSTTLFGDRSAAAVVPARANPVASDAIAIVSMSCRFPGGASCPEALWQLLDNGVDTMGDLPGDRGWDADALYDPDPEAKGKSYVRQGAFVHDAPEFDAAFFGISPREALACDPQQRLLLEASWECLERAGIDPRSLHGSATGLFFGLWQNSYGQLGRTEELEGFAVTGSNTAVASGRVAYSLGLQGPAISLDTACSSSLVTLHLACQSLHQGECDLALAGGSTVLATPAIFVEFSRQRGMASDGRCKPFSDAADGTGWGEGVGMVLVERLSDAQRHGHPVLALVRGSAVNQDGRSQGLTAPNGPAQEQVIRQALANAQLTAADIDAVEAHGTGTVLGDPIEAQALLATYGAGREAAQPLWLGSVKSNLGHTQAAAGAAGVIKMVLALQHERLPKSLCAEVPTRHVDWSQGGVKLLNEAVAWKRNGRPRRAAVSAFGISGTNAHVVLEEAPELDAGYVAEASPVKGPLAFVVSGRGQAALQAQASLLAAHLQVHPEQGLRDVAHSLVATRTLFETRAVLVSRERDQLLSQLTALAAGERPSGVAFGQAKASGKVVFVFPGQGSQWLGMARSLNASAPVFAAQLQACAEALAPYVEWSLLEVLASEDAALLERVDVVQPVLCAVMVSLAALWRAHGVEPDAVVGHSQGEIAAAYVAGALTLQDAARVVALRAHALTRLSGRGGMAAIEQAASELSERLERYAGKLSIAAINSPTSTVVSGETQALDSLLIELEREQILGRKIRVDYASHCEQLDEIKEELLAALASVRPMPTQIALYSTLRGEVVDGESLDGSYWYDNGRNTVRFSDAIAGLLASGHRHFVEVSAHPVLTQAVQSTAESQQLTAAVVGTLRRDQGELDRFLLSLGELHAQGLPVDFPRVQGGGRNVALPTYAFQHERFWPAGEGHGRAGDMSWAGLSASEHPLLGASVLLAEREGALLTGRLSLSSQRWLAGHVVFGTTLLPGTAFVELALKAAHSVGLDAIEELTLEAPLALPERGGVQLQLWVGALDAAGTRPLVVHSRRDDSASDAEWTRHASGTLTTSRAHVLAAQSELRQWPPAGAEILPLADLYEQLALSGLQYSGLFCGLRAAYRRGDELFAEVRLPDDANQEAARYGLHPALLDAALQVLVLRGGAAVALPFAWQGVSLYAAGATALRVKVTGASAQQATLTFADESGEPVGSIEMLRLRAATAGQVRSAADASDALYRLEWLPLTAAEVRASLPRWSLLAASDELATLLEDAPSYPDLAALRSALDDGMEAPEVVLLPCPAAAADDADMIERAHRTTHRALEQLQAWLADERLAGSRLVLVTRGAVAAASRDRVTQLDQAPVWGLVRGLRSERPELDVRLLDLDDSPLTAALLGSALAADEPQLALREGAWWMPRLTRRGADRTLPELQPLAADATVLITGGTGTLGGLLAEHLVEAHGVRQLLLCSRTGQADALRARLVARGAHVTIAACDVSQRGELEALLASIPAEHPLQAVFHTAGALDDGVIEAQSPARVDRVFGPKLAGAWHLHELTRALELRAFVLFSSASGVLGGVGQSNYAAANTFLDALAQHRKVLGLPCTSLAWGHWEQKSGLTGHLADADLARMTRRGVRSLSSREGMALLDAALASAEPLLVPVRFDARLFATPAEQLPALLRGLAQRRLRRVAEGSGASSPLKARLSALPAAERERALQAAIAAAISTVMGMPAASIDADRPLSELGLDSLMAVELRNQLAGLSGLRLPSTLLFDYPTPDALRRFLDAQLGGVELEIRAHSAVMRARAGASDPVAIIGMSCRFPSAADSPEALWELLEAGADVISAFPEDRGWDVEELYDPDPGAKGKTSAREGGFVREVASFDAGFFGISPREAVATDPQHRLLLETAWECLERAAIDPRSLHGSSTGVFIGLMSNDYMMVSMDLDESSGTGSVPSVASGRIAYTLGLQGPALTIDTACSSSLVALHLACQSLRQDECKLALAGGATVNATPSVFVEFSRQRGLAADGRCKSFSDSADGSGFSDGVGMVVLERLSDAQRYGHPVLALVRGSAVNQDGKSQGLTAPNGPAQEQVIRQALANAQLKAADIDAVEAHGTGTVLGDPIEAQALLATYGSDRLLEQPLWLGSVKSNLGHTQAAAGVAGVIKLVLALQHQLLPKTLHAEAPTHHVDWSEGTIKLLQEAVAWKTNGRPRRAAVSSFGISGTNAHMILEEPPLRAARVSDAPGPATVLPFVLSAMEEPALAAQAGRLCDHLEAHPEQSLVDTAFALVATRAALSSRAVVVTGERSELLDALRQLQAGHYAANVVRGNARKRGPLAVLFTGQGSQRAGMGRELYEAAAPFRAALDAVFEGFEGLLAPSLRDVMFAAEPSPEAELLHETGYAQPALFALEVALYRLMEACGVRADYLLGHSLGEIVAAHVAGVMTLSDACKLVAARGRLMQALPSGGAMAALQGTEAEVLPLLASAAGRLSLAAENGPSSVVVSGDEAAVEAVVAEWTARGHKAHRLLVSHAFHSALMEPMLEELAAVASSLQLRAAELPIASNVTGELAPAESFADPAYWVAHVREAVRFHRSVMALHAAGVGAYLELGPSAVLSALVHEALPETTPSVHSALRKDRGEVQAWLAALGGLHATGQRVDFRAWLAPLGGHAVPLPTYAFQRERYWPEAGGAIGRPTTVAQLGLTSPAHPLLTTATTLADGEGALFSARLSLTTHKWLAGHVIHGVTLFPGTGFVELALAAVQGMGMGMGGIEELTLEAPLVIPARGGLQLQLAVGPLDDAGTRSVVIYTRAEHSAPDAAWTRHASGRLCAVATEDATAADGFSELGTWPPAEAEAVELQGLYERMATGGVEYGEVFRGLRAVYRRGEALFAEVSLPDSAHAAAAHYNLHPALVDAALHVVGLGEAGEIVMPFAWLGVKLLATGAATLRVKLEFSGKHQLSLWLADAAGRPVARVQQLQLRAASAAQVRRASSSDGSYYHLEWTPCANLATPVAAPAPWALLGADAELSAAGPDAQYADVASLMAALDANLAVPDLVVVPCLRAANAHVVSEARGATVRALAILQAWATHDRLAQLRLLMVTRDAVAATETDRVGDLVHAPLWGMVRSAQSERPDLDLRLLDLDVAADGGSVREAVAACVAPERGAERQFAVRGRELHVPRLVRGSAALAVPATDHWSLQIQAKGTFAGLGFVPHESRPLHAGEVRVAVRAAGLNFRDVLTVLGMYPGEALPIGYEGAGIVSEVAADVVDLKPGDRVLGSFLRAFGPSVAVPRCTLVPMPRGLSFVQAASVPTAFSTAYYGLLDLAGLRAGERVLVHAAAGGVGMAAVQLARYLGAEVFATASPSKWPVLRQLGIPDDHIASSRTLDFEPQFRAVSNGQGMDVVLDSLARELVDASLRLLKPGGRFLEMGKTDIRDPARVAADHRGVVYRAFDTTEAGMTRMHEMLCELMRLFEAGVLQPPPVTVWDVRQAREAFRFMAQARHVGKIVLTIPQPLAAEGTVLITGGAGMLGAALAEHLVARHGVRHLLLCSRTGRADALKSQLEAQGAHVTVAACDISQRDQVAALLDNIPAAHPLSAVIHTAAVIDDGVLAAQNAQRIEPVFASKLDGAYHLHELTRGYELDAFVLCSSISGVLGGPGQSNYAAANAFLDALAQHRRGLGLCASSLAWGQWAELSGLTKQLSQSDLERLAKGGVQPLSTAEGLALFDAAYAGPDLQPVLVHFDARMFQAAADMLPPMLRGLSSRRLRQATNDADAATFKERLLSVSAAERGHVLQDMVSSAIAAVMGLAASKIELDRPLSDLGLDSLMAVELRNLLAARSGLRLPSTVLFDQPTVSALCRYLEEQLSGQTVKSARPLALGPAAQPSAADPIAIIAMSCRFPGEVDSTEALWALLAEGRDAITAVPRDRAWDVEGLMASDPDASAKFRGGFVNDVTTFDPLFFGISPREAIAIEPQQRLLLETAWEALESAGIDAARLQGSSTGVFVGLSGSDYMGLIGGEGALEYSATGIASSVASGRIAYCLGLQGPALTIDTACSSSLVAAHVACQSLRQRECDLALVGGASLMTTPSALVGFGGYGVMAQDGRCKPFSDAADGTCWGEGIGMLLLERLSDARRENHPVLALVRGSAVNQDGRSQGLTAPNGPAQEELIRTALENAGLSAADIDAVEAHGTGTKLGDPIEAQALIATYGGEREQPLWLGSVKSNFGHTQAAAGVAGVIKMVLALQHELLPQTLHAEPPTRHVDWPSAGLKLLSQRVAWPRGARPRRAAVSSFGMSGTNAHMILEEAREAPPTAAGDERVLALPFVLSARSEEALREQAARLRQHLLALPALRLADVALSLVTTRSSFAVRAVAVAAEREPLLESLHALATGEANPRVVLSQARTTGKLVFVFPGQGAQWSGMTRELMRTAPVFAAQMQMCAEALVPYVKWSLLDVLDGDDEASLQRLEVLQPVLFCVMVSLAALWRSKGIEPDAVVGHSQGEIAAAYVAGALSLDDALRIVASRAQIIQPMIGKGAMAAVMMPLAQLRRRLERFDGRLSIAAINDPQGAVVSGEPEPVTQLLAELAAEGIFARPVKGANGAGHSAQVDQYRQALLESFASIAPRTTKIPLYSTVEADVMDGERLDAEHWYRNVRETVRFSETVEQLIANGYRHYVEMSVHPLLTKPIQATAEACQQTVSAVGTLRRDHGGLDQFLLSLGELHARGLSLAWNRVLEPGCQVALPTYAFQRQRYWPEPSAGGDVASAGLASADHPLLGASVLLAAGDGAVFTGRLSRARHEWLWQNTVFGTAVLSSSALLELSLTAAQRVGLEAVMELKPEQPVLLPAHSSLQLQLSVSGLDDAGCRTLTIHARPEAGAEGAEVAWTLAASARLGGRDEAAAQALPEPASWPPVGAEEVDIGGVYEALAAAGVSSCELTASLHALYQRGDECFADLRLPERAAPQASRYALHPALVEALVHVLAFRAEQPLKVLSWQGVALAMQGCSALRVHLQQRDADEVSLLLADEHGEPVGQITALRTAPLSAADVHAAAPRRGQLYRVDWTALSESGHERARTWAALGPLHPKLSRPSSRFEDWAQLCAALDGGQPVPELVVLSCSNEAGADADLPSRARRETVRALELLQAWLSDPRLLDSELIVLTQRAVCAGEADDVADLAHAPLWGMLRAAQSEYPDRALTLIDWDESEASSAAFASALRQSERQLALRQGQVLTPRLTRVNGSESVAVRPLSSEGTVLISGGTGVLGALLARHLVARYGVKHLLLCSRTGRADALQRELSAQGASVRVLTCDVSEREQVAALLAAIPAQHPLCAVFHVARALDDATLTVQSAARIERTFAPKVDGAWHLHELTRTCPLQAFVLFSSLAGTIGAPGQANYSAANAFLDALAHHRRAQGLPATSLGWGLWSDADSTDSTGDTARAARGLVEALSVEESLQLMDAALCSSGAQLLPVCIGPRLHRMPSELLPALLRPLRVAMRPSSGAAPTAGVLRARLKQAPVAEREQVMLDAVLGAVSSVLRVAKAKLDPDQPLQELGMDSLNALQLRGQLVSITGLTLPATLLFECNTPRAFVKRFGPALLHDVPATVPRASAAVGPTNTPLVSMVRAAMQAATAESDLAMRADVWRLMDSATDMRRQLARNASDPTWVSNAYPMSRGASDPVLICLPSLMPPTGPGQYLRFAAALQGVREAWVLSLPGWGVGEPLPLSRESVLACLGRAALQCAGGRPFALCGGSSGGWIAHALAAWLEKNEVGPEAVVLVDSQLIDDAYFAIDPSTGMPVLRHVLGLPGSAVNAMPDPSCDEELSAWIQYLELFKTWRPSNIRARTLMLLPNEQLFTPEGQQILVSTGGLTDNDDLVQVAGDHMSMMIEHAESTARAAEEWVSQHVSKPSAAAE